MPRDTQARAARALLRYECAARSPLRAACRRLQLRPARPGAYLAPCPPPARAAGPPRKPPDVVLPGLRVCGRRIRLQPGERARGAQAQALARGRAAATPAEAAERRLARSGCATEPGCRYAAAQIWRAGEGASGGKGLGGGWGGVGGREGFMTIKNNHSSKPVAPTVTPQAAAAAATCGPDGSRAAAAAAVSGGGPGPGGPVPGAADPGASESMERSLIDGAQPASIRSQLMTCP
jgi:hypothetical protein